MATTTVSMGAEAAVNGPRFSYRATVADGDTLNIIKLPVNLPINVKVYRGTGATISVYSSTDTEAAIEAGTANKFLWAQGAVVADAEDTLNLGHVGIIVSTTGGTAGVEVTA